MMSEHEKHTAFLRQCLLYDESARRQELAAGISRIQCDLRCVRRGMWLMVILSALVVAGLGYGVLLVHDFPHNLPPLFMNLIYSLGLGLLISLLGFVGLGIVYRQKLNQHREECRQLVTRLLESRLGKPVATTLRDARVGESEDRSVQAANEDNAAPASMESATGS